MMMVVTVSIHWRKEATLVKPAAMPIWQEGSDPKLVTPTWSYFYSGSFQVRDSDVADAISLMLGR